MRKGKTCLRQLVTALCCAALFPAALPGMVCRADEGGTYYTIEEHEQQPRTVLVESVSLDRKELNLMPGSSAVIKASVSPDNAADKTVVFKSSNPKAATVSSSGTVKAVGRGTAVITASSADGGASAQCSVRVLFTDVPIGASYYKQIYWADDRGILAGRADGSYGSTATITRGHVMVFLWRAAGRPKAALRKQKYTDVPPTSGYFDAIQWAVENGIAAGKADGSFGINLPITRGAMMYFLWRYAGRPEPAGKKQVYTDVPVSNAYFKAVQWSVEKKIAVGYSDGSFGIKRYSTRGHFAAYIYRMLAN